jgi:hypothetical protein
MLSNEMTIRGSYKIASRSGAFDGYLDPALRCARRVERILDSLRAQITADDRDKTVRIRRILSEPREVFRLEIEIPEQGYQRTTLLDRDALEELLEAEEVRERLRGFPPEN